jgi:hypothetical protein
MAEQLRLWKAGIGHSMDGGSIRRPVAEKFSDEDIDAVASGSAFSLRPSHLVMVSAGPCRIVGLQFDLQTSPST